jgi:hypothetical protein
MTLRISALIQNISTVSLLSALTLSVGSPNPAQAFALTLGGKSSGSWTLPANATSSTQLSGQNGGTNNFLEWGLTRVQVPTCEACTDFNNFIRFNGTQFNGLTPKGKVRPTSRNGQRLSSPRFNPKQGSVFSLGQLTYRNASTTDIVNGQFQTVDFAFPLQVSVLFNQPNASKVDFNFDFSIRNTPNIPGDPIASADILNFNATGTTSQSIELGGKRYQLTLLGFGDTTGALSGEFRIPEAVGNLEFFTASLFARLDREKPPGGGACRRP